MTTIFTGYSRDPSGELEYFLRIVPPCSDEVARGIAKALTAEDYYVDEEVYPARKAQMTGNSESGTTVWTLPNTGVRDAIPPSEALIKADALRIARRAAFLLDPWPEENGGITIHVHDEVSDLGHPYIIEKQT